MNNIYYPDFILLYRKMMIEEALLKKYTFRKFLLENTLEKILSKNGLALKYISKELKNDKNMVLLAVKSNGNALKYASEELQKDPEIINIAEKNLNNKLMFK